MRDASLCLLYLLDKSYRNQNYMDVLLRPKSLPILFDRLQDGEEKRMILSRIIRNLFFENDRGTEA